ncbi:MAG: ABC transporter ATP-binding protein [Patescibacteria group bacterium]|mgnify:CR=1 FL=1
MNNKIIQVTDLKKVFTSFKKKEGLKASFKDFFKREKISTDALKGVSFEIEKGEFIGFLGPNGAGKTTTLKMLTGILTPSSGEAKILGYTPWKRENAFKKKFSFIMGQKGQLWWDLPPLDSYELFKHIYEIPNEKYKKNLKFLTELLQIEDIIEVQTRKLSLGQRMKAELVGALIHSPEILFLDEPTIGLDVVAQHSIREFLKTYNKETNATIILTSHYMEDIKRLCERVLIIDHGSLIYDGTYQHLTKKFAQDKTVELTLNKRVDQADLTKYGKILELTEDSVRLSVPREKSTKLIAEMMEKLPIEDISVHERTMEDIVSEIFQNKHV